MRAMLRATLVGGLFVLGLSGPLQAAEHVVEISGNRFVPAELRIKAGDTVTWINREKRTSHSIVFKHSGEESERFFPGESWSRLFAEAGTIPYICGPHPEMGGLVVVED